MRNEWLMNYRRRMHLCTECGDPAEKVEDSPEKYHSLCARCREKKAQNKGTLCWSCKNSLPDGKTTGCAWSMYKKPVKGWTAQETKMKIAEGDYRTSYYVKECPEYVKG